MRPFSRASLGLSQAGALVWLAAWAAACASPSGAERPPEHAAEPAIVGGILTIPADRPELRALGTVAIGAGDRDAVSRQNGRLIWDEDVTVRVFTPIAGRVTKVAVDAGQRIEAGQVLALISSPDFGQAQADARRAAGSASCSGPDGKADPASRSGSTPRPSMGFSAIGCF